MTETTQRPTGDSPDPVDAPSDGLVRQQSRSAERVRQALEDLRVEARTATGGKRQVSWLDERLGTTGLKQKYGRKAFPVHTSFFLGEMATFSFIILIITGIYLGLIYVPSSAPVVYVPEGAPAGTEGYELPEAYASILLIESIPVANLLRSVHHWAAHVMIFSILLHTLRVLLHGAYRKPRELNYVVGVALLTVTIGAAFVGYSLPFDSYAVTATGIGYAIARSIPLIGEFASELFFGGAFPTLGSLPRLYTLHIFVLPLIIALLMSFHLLLVVKTKHTQPGYARRMSEPGRVLGVPLWPYQALLAGQLFFFMFAGLFILSAFVPAHPVEAYGPPGPDTPEVKPDWYLMWTYGLLKITPAAVAFNTPIGTISPNFLAGLVFPGLLFTVMGLAPWLDRTNRGRFVKRYEYAQPPTQAPVRLTIVVGLLSYVGMLFVAAYYDDPLGLTLGQMWLLSLAVPLGIAIFTYVFARWRQSKDGVLLDPTGDEPEDVDLVSGPSVVRRG